MKIPIPYMCKCGVADTLLLDEDQIGEGSLICTDCRFCHGYTICVSVKSIDKIKRQMDHAILIGKIERVNY